MNFTTESQELSTSVSMASNVALKKSFCARRVSNGMPITKINRLRQEAPKNDRHQLFSSVVGWGVVFHVARDGQEIGTFTESDLQAKIFTGEILPDDHYWREGFSDWKRVSDYRAPPKKSAVPPPLPAVPPPLTKTKPRRDTALIAIGVIAGFALLIFTAGKFSNDAERINAAAAAEREQKVKQAIDQHRILIGMSSEQVIEAWGRPSRINRTVGQKYVSEQWIYEWNNGRESYIYLDNGVLRTIQDSR